MFLFILIRGCAFHLVRSSAVLIDLSCNVRINDVESSSSTAAVEKTATQKELN
jgi:hypothetical protein